jgi:hypothetical protein
MSGTGITALCFLALMIEGGQLMLDGARRWWRLVKKARVCIMRSGRAGMEWMEWIEACINTKNPLFLFIHICLCLWPCGLQMRDCYHCPSLPLIIIIIIIAAMVVRTVNRDTRETGC